MDGWVDAMICAWMDGWMDGQMHAWLDGASCLTACELHSDVHFETTSHRSTVHIAVHLPTLNSHTEPTRPYWTRYSTSLSCELDNNDSPAKQFSHNRSLQPNLQPNLQCDKQQHQVPAAEHWWTCNGGHWSGNQSCRPDVESGRHLAVAPGSRLSKDYSPTRSPAITNSERGSIFTTSYAIRAFWH